jgi:uncharacterized protein (TIGR03086 family)
MEPIVMFERASAGAIARVAAVRPDHWQASTPCTEWDVRQLVEHMGGGPAYRLSALGAGATPAPDVTSYRTAVSSCLEALGEPGALERRCMSPAGFEWTVAEATAGTAMDQLVHTWDLAVATGQDRVIDAEVVDAVVATFLPRMPEVGRAAGIVGPGGGGPGGCVGAGPVAGRDGPATVTADDELDDVVKAVGHAGRRAMLRAARDEERTASELAAAAALSPSAASPHLKLLRELGLLHMRVDARRRLYRTDVDAIADVRAALAELWDDRLDALRTTAEADPAPRRRGRSA